jgi:hypothetical protein
MSQLFNPDSLPPVPMPAVTVRRDLQSAAMHSLARLKRFRAGAIPLTKDEINRDLNAVFQFVEQVTS